jgi:ribosomal protein L7/L12
MTKNPFIEQGNNVNAFKLIDCISYLIEQNMWNEMLRFNAASYPIEFISMVENYRENGSYQDYFSVAYVDVFINGIISANNKVSVITILRTMFGTGFAEAKNLIEAPLTKLITLENKSDCLKFCVSILINGGAKIKLVNQNKSKDAQYNRIHTPKDWKPEEGYILPIISNL